VSMWKGLRLMKTVRITIELDYDLANHYGEGSLKDLEEASDVDLANIVDDLEDNVYEDLIDLMRGDRLRFWSDVKVVG
jgi:hypothetical protein